MLTKTERQILAFEARHPRHTGLKRDLIRATFDLSPARYFQILGVLVNDREAVEADPILCRRIQNRVRRDRAKREALEGLNREAS